MVRAVAHYTVGADSRAIGRDGYFHWLVHRDESREQGCTQYAETSAVTWHAADAGNPYGPGIEFERQVIGGLNAEGLSEAEPLTPNQIAWGSRLVDHLAAWGIAPELYAGERYGAAGWVGWVNHRDLDSDRSDGLTRAEWALLTGGPGAPPGMPPLPKGRSMFVLVCGGLPYVAVVPELPEAYEVLDPGNSTTVVVTPEQRSYIINSVRGFAGLGD
jgi:hypothetical protein